MKKLHAAITGVEGYVPEHILTNEDLSKIVDTSDEWITTRTGIKERRIMRGGASSDIALEAVQGLLRKTNTNPLDIELVILATVTPDYPFPSTANVLCDKAGMTNAWVTTLLPPAPDLFTEFPQERSLLKPGGIKKSLWSAWIKCRPYSIIRTERPV